jgi:hypothetical protein
MIRAHRPKCLPGSFLFKAVRLHCLLRRIFIIAKCLDSCFHLLTTFSRNNYFLTIHGVIDLQQKREALEYILQ